MRRFLRVIVCAVAVIAVAAPAAPAASEPVVATGTATAITATSATLNGTVNPEGQATSYFFQYGTTTSYGSETATAAAGSGTASVNVSVPIASLAPQTTYHYRLVATNASGTTLGADVSFTTPRRPSPVVDTKHPSDVTQTAATLTGTVDPEGEPTSYVFEYGTSVAYGSRTPTGSAGAGTATLDVSATLGPLAPDTTYHYRLVASNAAGTTYGHDVSFTTAAVPGGVTIGAFPGTVTFGGSTTLSGHVLPPRPSHVAVTLQSAPSAAGPWIDTATSATTTSGAYSFRPTAPTSDIYYRALADGATSGPVLVLVRFRVGVRVSSLHPVRGSWVRFHGQVRPAHFWLRVLVQWLGPRGRWQTIRRTRLRAAAGGVSVYGVRVRIERSGRYRVVVGPDNGHARGRSATVRIRVR
ncbi:MAG TPA: hypothetical protein VEF89_04195 [Solirubrobacteraceae bacterium]|nr:hypothetical protein [Solirubrobacteraceae bacterium]